MKQTDIERIPMPMPQEIESLPTLASDLLSMFEGSIPRKDYKALARVFVDTVSGNVPTLNKTSLMYKNPSVRTLMSSAILEYGEYNPDKIPIQTYEKMRLDPQIAIGTALIELPILAQNWRIESDSDTNAVVCNAIVKPIYRNLLKNLLKAVCFGYACGEKSYDQKKLKITRTEETGRKKTVYNDWATIIDRIKFAHPSSIRIIRDKKTEDIKYVTQSPDYIRFKRPKKISIKKCIWFAPDEEYGNFFGRSRYQAAYQPWYFSQILMQFMVRYLERRGAPSVISKAPPGFSTDTDGNKVDNLDIGMKAAESLISNSVVVIPQKFDKVSGKPLWDISLLQDDQRGDMFIEALRYLNVMKMRALLVPDRTSISEGSSTNATVEGHTDLHLLEEEALIQLLEEAIDKQILEDIVKYNFPVTQQAPCYIKIERLNHSKRTLVRDIFVRMLMLSSTAVREGRPPVWAPSLKKMADFLEIPGDEFDNIFLPLIDGDGNDKNTPEIKAPDDEDDPNSSDKDKEDIDAPLDKEQKVKERAKDAVPRKEKTRRERRDRERI